MVVEVAACVCVPRRFERLYPAEVLRVVAMAAVEPPPLCPSPALAVLQGDPEFWETSDSSCFQVSQSNITLEVVSGQDHQSNKVGRLAFSRTNRNQTEL